MSKTNAMDVLTEFQRLSDLMENVSQKTEAPFREMFTKQDFDPDKDYLVFSLEAARRIGITERNIPQRMKERVLIRNHVPGSKVVLLKNTLEDLNKLPPYRFECPLGRPSITDIGSEHNEQARIAKTIAD